MASEWQERVDGILDYLHQCREEGIRYVAVEPALLERLEAPRPTSEAGRGPVGAGKPRQQTAGAALAPVPGREGPEGAARGQGSPMRSNVGISRSREAVAEAMRGLDERTAACVQCAHLAETRQHVVFGVGDIDADLMFVGEAPGLDEDRQGEPFVGKAGQLLTRIIETMGLSRAQVYIANILKCRPDTPGRRFGNRKPRPEEMSTCRPYLIEQIRLVQPRVLVALGATAVEGLLGVSSVFIGRCRGQFVDFEGIPLLPTYHPAYVLRDPSLKIKRQIWEDMLRVMERLGMGISEKQQQYFLKAD